MGVVISWLRNNLVTVVEIVAIAYDAIEIVVNGLARLIPGNKTIKVVHDILAKIDGPLKRVKDFLLGRVA